MQQEAGQLGPEPRQPTRRLCMWYLHRHGRRQEDPWGTGTLWIAPCATRLLSAGTQATPPHVYFNQGWTQLCTLGDGEGTNPAAGHCTCPHPSTGTHGPPRPSARSVSAGS